MFNLARPTQDINTLYIFCPFQMYYCMLRSDKPGSTGDAFAANDYSRIASNKEGEANNSKYSDDMFIAVTIPHAVGGLSQP